MAEYRRAAAGIPMRFAGRVRAKMRPDRVTLRETRRDIVVGK